MPTVDNFWLYLGVDSADPIFQQISDSASELIILEAGNTSDTPGVNPSLTASELQLLRDEGRIVIGYVNVAVPDHNRSFWDETWVTPSALDSDDLDYGTPTANAPAWLHNAIGTAGGPEEPGDDGESDGIYGFIVDYTDSEWQDLVIGQARELIRAGYGGVFLDDVGRYYDAWRQEFPSADLDNLTAEQENRLAELATDMMDFVTRTVHEIQLIDPQAYVAINRDIFMYWHAQPDPDGTEAWDRFIPGIDGLMTENSYPNTWWQTANDTFANPIRNPIGHDTIDLLAVEWATALNSTQQQDFLGSYTDSNGLVPLLSPDSAYDTAPPQGAAPVGYVPPSPVVSGTAAADMLLGTLGNDTLRGFMATDTIYGGDGDDVIYGGPGDDLIFAGAGNDTIYGGGGNDTIIGGAGHDLIFGGNGADTIFGAAGNDTINGGAGADFLSGGAPPDEFVFL